MTFLHTPAALGGLICSPIAIIIGATICYIALSKVGAAKLEQLQKCRRRWQNTHKRKNSDLTTLRSSEARWISAAKQESGRSSWEATTICRG